MADPLFEITVQHAGAELARYPLAPGEYTIGRASASSIPIQVGPVSRQHARVLVSESGAVQVEDLASANGTLLDEQPIAGLSDWLPGQILRIGDASLTFDAIARDVTVLDVSALDAAGILRQHLPLVTRQSQDYAIGAEVARGGMGAVLQACESATRRTVAMKIMLGRSDAKSTLRFIEEAQVTAQLEHPNIVPVHDLGINAHGQPYYTMKLVAGITLKKVLELLGQRLPETVRKYPLGTLLTAFQKIGDALAFAHSRGVIHRDLKPANIMLGKYGEVLVMDWGLAKIVGTGGGPTQAETLNPEVTVIGARREQSDVFSTLDGAVMGTAHYMSPEQARGEVETLDARSDVFTLGIILYELVTLARPFTGKTAAEIINAVSEGAYLPPAACVRAMPKAARPAHLPGGEIPESLDAIIRKALAPDKAARYASVTALQRDLAAYQTGFATGAESRSAWKQVKLLIKRNKAASVGIAAVLLVGTTLGTKAVLEGHRAEREAVRANAALSDLKKQAPALRQFAESEAGFQRFDSALEKFEAALVLDPAHLPSYWRRAWLLMGMDRMADAVAAIRLAQQKDPAHGALAAILPTVEKLAALRPGENWPADSARQIYEHLVKVAASGEIVAIAPKAKLSGKENEKLVRRRVDEWLGKGQNVVQLDPTGVVLHVHLHGLPIDALEPLRGLRIHSINIGATNVTSLEPLRGMQLTSIFLGQLKIADYSPLKGAPLRSIYVNSSPIRDLSFLSEAPLEELMASDSAITDLTPLRGKPLRTVGLSNVNVSDLSPLLGAPVEELNIERSVKIQDLSLLLKFPKLEKLRVSKLGKVLEPLRAHPSLKFIAYDNEPYRPVAEFWADYDAEHKAGAK